MVRFGSKFCLNIIYLYFNDVLRSLKLFDAKNGLVSLNRLFICMYGSYGVVVVCVVMFNFMTWNLPYFSSIYCWYCMILYVLNRFPTSKDNKNAEDKKDSANSWLLTPHFWFLIDSTNLNSPAASHSFLIFVSVFFCPHFCIPSLIKISGMLIHACIRNLRLFSIDRRDCISSLLFDKESIRFNNNFKSALNCHHDDYDVNFFQSFN